MNETNRFFLAIIPPEPVYTVIDQYKNEACEKFNTCAALNSPPHITLFMPFSWKEKRIERLHQALENFSSSSAQLTIEVRSVGQFGERVIFLAPSYNSELLSLQASLAKTVRRELNLLNANYKDRGFHPHITIAFRDLKKQFFDEAYAYFDNKTIDLSFTVSNFSLLKHNGKKWEDYQRFDF